MFNNQHGGGGGKQHNKQNQTLYNCNINSV